MHLVQTAEVYHTQKRKAQAASLASGGPKKGRPWVVGTKESLGETLPAPVEVVRETPQPQTSSRPPQPTPPPHHEQLPKKRASPRRLPVHINKRDVWSRLGQVDAGLSMAEWLAMDKRAYKDVRDGLRFLHGRVPRSSKERTNLVNALAVLNDDEEAGSWESESNDDYGDADSEEVAYGTDTESTGYESDDTTYEYPYSYQTMQKSQPLKAPIVINNEIVWAVFDSGASVSVISKRLAERLGLRPNGDKLRLATMEQGRREPCAIVPNVPVRVAGKLRPEHMCVETNPMDPDLCLLGMTWFKAYGIEQRPKDGTILIPTRHGRSYVELQGSLGRDDASDSEEGNDNDDEVVNESDETAEVYAVEMREAKSASLFNNKDVADEPLLGYLEEVMTEDWGSEKERNVPPEIQSVVENNQKSFVEVSGLGRLQGVEHEIPTTNETPIRSRPYRLTWEEDQHLRRELDELLDLGLIRPSAGVWTSPIFFVKKKEGTLRLVVNYQKLNQITVKDAFPLPRIDELLDSMGGARWFSTLDAASGYWQVPMADSSIAKTGFVTKYGTYEFKVMPFGLTSAPSTFQRAMTNILSSFIGKFVYVFIDDVIVYSRTPAEHANHLRLVFDACTQANLRLKRSKCTFGSNRVEYLGHVVSSQGLEPSQTNVQKILDLKRPECTDEVHTFLGMTGYYRRFVPGYTEIALPLNRLLRKDQPFRWGGAEQEAFDSLKHALVNPPVLAYPDRDQVQIITTDASTRGLGAILSQAPADNLENETVVAYASRTVRGPELNYATTHLEALGVVWGINNFRHYLSGRRFILRTDHAALQYILTNPRPTPKLARWAAALMEYDYTVEYRPGKRNPADALSRLV